MTVTTESGSHTIGEPGPNTSLSGPGELWAGWTRAPERACLATESERGEAP